MRPCGVGESWEENRCDTGDLSYCNLEHEDKWTFNCGSLIFYEEMRGPWNESRIILEISYCWINIILLDNLKIQAWIRVGDVFFPVQQMVESSISAKL